MQNKPSTASDKETGQKGKKAYIGRKDSVKIKKSYHYYKGLYQELLYFPHPICWKSTRASSTLYSCQISDQSILNQSKTKEKETNKKEIPNPPQTIEQQLQSSNSKEEKVAIERGDGGDNPMNGFLISLLPGDGWRILIKICS